MDVLKMWVTAWEILIQGDSWTVFLLIHMHNHHISSAVLQ